MAKKKMSLKLLVDSNANKVLFAEAESEFVDFLFHILSLPVGTVVKLLNVNGMAGSIGSLYKSVESLNSRYFRTNVSRDVVLKPKAVVNLPLLKLNDGPTNDRIYVCKFRCSYASKVPGVKCSVCSREMDKELTYVIPEDAEYVETRSRRKEGYVKRLVTYMVMDNLEVKPMSTISGITLINKLDANTVSALVEKEVKVGFTEGLAMLKAAFEVTDTVLTTVFLSKKAKYCSRN